jgi:outer membrane protein OmpA-like peptidoglycan-associated protein
MAEEFDIVSGEFEGNFFTHQKSVLTTSEWNALKKEHAINLYRGELINISKEAVYQPEKFRNRESLLLHNVTNVQFHSKNSSGENTSKIYDFEQLLIRDAEIKESWELNGKTYGIIRGKALGKVLQRNSSFDPRNPSELDTPEITKLGPIENKDFVFRNEVSDAVRQGIGCLNGCMSNIWRLLLALSLLIFVLWLMRSCVGDYISGKDCNELEYRKYEIQKELDSLQTRINEIYDSIDHFRAQEELDYLSSRVYFKGNTHEILKYSEDQLIRIVEILNERKNLKIEVRGYYNGTKRSNPKLDLERANTIRDLLIENGVSASDIRAIGMGQSFIDDAQNLRTIQIGDEEVKWNRNMRVEIKLIRK